MYRGMWDVPAYGKEAMLFFEILIGRAIRTLGRQGYNGGTYLLDGGGIYTARYTDQGTIYGWAYVCAL